MSNYLLLIAAMISWGLSNPLADWAVSALSAAAQTLLEISSGFLVITIFYLLRPNRFRDNTYSDVSWSFAAFLGAVQPGFAWLMGNYGYKIGRAHV